MAEISEVFVLPVHDQNFGVSAAIQGLDEIASDKPGAAGYDPHGYDCLGAFFLESLPKITESFAILRS
jgi:hypothetical protein